MSFKDEDFYHANLNAVYKEFADFPMALPLAAVATFLGLDKRTLISTRGFPIKKSGNRYIVMKTALASWMTKEDKI